MDFFALYAFFRGFWLGLRLVHRCCARSTPWAALGATGVSPVLATCAAKERKDRRGAFHECAVVAPKLRSKGANTGETPVPPSRMDFFALSAFFRGF
jgi:hypothetical protein